MTQLTPRSSFTRDHSTWRCQPRWPPPGWPCTGTLGRSRCSASVPSRRVQAAAGGGRLDKWGRQCEGRLRWVAAPAAIDIAVTDLRYPIGTSSSLASFRSAPRWGLGCHQAHAGGHLGARRRITGAGAAATEPARCRTGRRGARTGPSSLRLAVGDPGSGFGPRRPPSCSSRARCAAAARVGPTAAAG